MESFAEIYTAMSTFDAVLCLYSLKLVVPRQNNVAGTQVHF